MRVLRRTQIGRISDHSVGSFAAAQDLLASVLTVVMLRYFFFSLFLRYIRWEHQHVFPAYNLSHIVVHINQQLTVVIMIDCVHQLTRGVGLVALHDAGCHLFQIPANNE